MRPDVNEGSSPRRMFALGLFVEGEGKSMLMMLHIDSFIIFACFIDLFCSYFGLQKVDPGASLLLYKV